MAAVSDGRSMPGAGAAAGMRVLRALGVAALAVAALVSLLLLVVWSVSGEWFFPALVPTSWSLQGWEALLHGGALVRAATTSLGLGVVVGIVACAVGLPIGRALARVGDAWRPAALAAVLLPAAAPPIAMATGLQLTFIATGLAGSFAGVALAHLVPATGVVAYFFCAVFAVYDGRVDEEARSLGATPRQVWMRVTLPLLLPELFAGAALGFLVSWGQVPLTLIIGGGAVHTLSVDVFAYAAAGEARFAAAGALLLIGPAAAVLALTRGARRLAVTAEPRGRDV